MRILGINSVAVLLATAAYAVIGYLTHMTLVDLEAWNAAKHVDEAELSNSRMAFGLILPLFTVTGLAVLFRWGGVTRVGDGLRWALVVALASALPALWYNWFYGTPPIWTFWIDSGHQLAGHLAAGAILARWR